MKPLHWSTRAVAMWAWAMEEMEPEDETQNGHNQLKTFRRWAHDIVEGVREEHGFCDWYWFLHGYFLSTLPVS